MKRSLSISGHRTSVSIEGAFWTELQGISRRDGRSLAALVAAIDGGRSVDVNLSSAIRLFVLEDMRRRLEASERLDAAG